MQWQGELPDPAPLLGLHRRGSGPVLCEADLAEQMAMDGYAGSVAISGDTVGITSPRGGRVQLFGLDGAFRGAVLRADVCGLAPGSSGLVATDGMGGVLRLDGPRVTPLTVASRHWDNHLVSVGA